MPACVCVCVRCVDLSLLQVRLKELENATGAKMQNTPISTNRYVSCDMFTSLYILNAPPPIGFNSDRLSVVTIHSKCGSKPRTRIVGQPI